MRAFVWIDAWQQQCCGADFAVGSNVRWRVKQNPDGNEWIDLILGTEWSQRVGFVEDHHVADTDGLLSGLVWSISVVTCDRVLADEAGPGSGRLMVPVAGSGRLRSVDVADRWEPEPRKPNGVWTFDGWIVGVDPAEFTEAPAQGEPGE